MCSVHASSQQGEYGARVLTFPRVSREIKYIFLFPQIMFLHLNLLELYI